MPSFGTMISATTCFDSSRFRQYEMAVHAMALKLSSGARHVVYSWAVSCRATDPTQPPVTRLRHRGETAAPAGRCAAVQLRLRLQSGVP